MTKAPYLTPGLRSPDFLPEPQFLDDVLELSRREENPFYVYQESGIRAQCQKFLRIPYAPKSVHFATMANINPDFLRIIRSEGMRVFVNSLQHLGEVQSLGFTGEEIVFTASALEESALRQISASGAQLNLDSLDQFQKWKGSDRNGGGVGLRCNIGELVDAQETHAGFFIGKQSRLGLTRNELEQLKGDDRIRGLHVYVGTDILDLDYFLGCYRALGSLVPYFPNLEYLNFGGGFGVEESGADSFPIEEYGKQVSTLMQELSSRSGRPLRLVLEPGRIIGGASGYFICRVTDVKVRPEKTFIGVNASSVQFPRPLLYPETAHHPVAIFREGRRLRAEALRKSVVYGCSTYSRDFLRRSVLLPPVSVGDTLILGNAGSYCTSAYTEFLGFPKPKEFFL